MCRFEASNIFKEDALKTPLKWYVLAMGLAALGACGGGSASDPQQVTFVIRLHGLGPGEEFRVRSADPAFIAKARQQLALPEAQRHLFPIGGIVAGDGGYNSGWGWHFSQVQLAEAAIELCDGRPSMVQADLPYWLGTVKQFCPWPGYVHAEQG